MAVRGVIFDVGGVLVESPFVAALRWRDELGLPDEVMGAMFAEYASVPEPGGAPPPWHLVEVGKLDLDSFIRGAQTTFAKLVPEDHVAMKLTGADFNVFANAGALWPMIHRVRELRAAGYVTAILTNNVREWADWRKVIPIDEFDVVVDSCEVGLRKPDPAIWDLTLEHMGLDAAEAVFLDDHPQNVEAARAMGIRSVFVGPDIDEAIAKLKEELEPS